ncbi:MAG TPA: DUF3300 domain-containing protein [Chthoniobacterales bacterium]|jgi:hypothetical protein|nr:DUF3300 domain-containing protein [Chthoniobacterales bacterium]
MNISGGAAGFSRPRLGNQILVFVLFATWPHNLPADQAAQAPAPSYTQQTSEQLQQLVAPIALYPDSLVAQILTASTFPEQVVQADRWLQAHPDLTGDALAKAVDQQPWDPSVKALTAFPPVLGNMDKNLSWTSSLGDAYYNQPEDVMDGIQDMRQQAQEAGTLQTTPQESVAMQDSTIAIEPTNPDTVYVPAYNPWQAYGAPIDPWPDWYSYPGIWYDGPGCWFGAGVGIGFFGGFEWGCRHWGCDWHHRFVMHDHNRYQSPSTTFYNRNNFYRRGSPAVAARGLHARANAANMSSNANIGERALRVPEDLRQNMENRRPPGTISEQRGVYNRSRAMIRPFNGNIQAARGYGEPRGQSGVHSSAFSGYNHGGQTRGFSSRGSASVGGGAVHVGGGGHGAAAGVGN